MFRTQTTPAAVQGVVEERHLAHQPSVAEGETFTFSGRALFADGPRRILLDTPVAIRGESGNTARVRELFLPAAVDEYFGHHLSSDYSARVRLEPHGGASLERFEAPFGMSGEVCLSRGNRWVLRGTSTSIPLENVPLERYQRMRHAELTGRYVFESLPGSEPRRYVKVERLVPNREISEQPIDHARLASLSTLWRNVGAYADALVGDKRYEGSNPLKAARAGALQTMARAGFGAYALFRTFVPVSRPRGEEQEVSCHDISGILIGTVVGCISAPVAAIVGAARGVIAPLAP